MIVKHAKMNVAIVPIIRPGTREREVFGGPGISTGHILNEILPFLEDARNRVLLLEKWREENAIECCVLGVKRELLGNPVNSHFRFPESAVRKVGSRAYHAFVNPRRSRFLSQRLTFHFVDYLIGILYL